MKPFTMASEKEGNGWTRGGQKEDADAASSSPTSIIEKQLEWTNADLDWCCLSPTTISPQIQQGGEQLAIGTAKSTTDFFKDDDEGEESKILSVSRHLLQPNGSISGQKVADVILPKFKQFASAIPLKTHSMALASIDGRQPISHKRVYEFVTQEFGPSLHKLGFGKGDRIALVLPNGPELALAIIATANWASCVPLSANGATAELEADLIRCGANLVIGPYSGEILQQQQASKNSVQHGGDDMDWSAFRSIEESARKLNIPFCGLVPSPTDSGIFRLLPTRSSKPVRFDEIAVPPDASPRDRRRALSSSQLPNAAQDEVLVLFTSGTTGNKKLVPHLMGDMLTAATTIALSWDLTPRDANINLMPLFHVGGIVRSVFSPLISGGGAICCPSFDPLIFWTLLEKQMFTWYYAAPTMHQLILQTGRSNGFIDNGRRKKLKLRMIANAAGGLLPSLAEEMVEAFDANVLPSYGMTECMPISSPPAKYRLEKPGTSGVPVGPEVAVLNPVTVERLKPGEEGPVCVRGTPCFRGYGQIANDSNQKVGDTFLKGGWFNTGDLGFMDEDGYLFMTGRSKEVINRGGEIISPMEVEDAVLKSHPEVSACAAFSAPHDVMQEVVGIVLVMKANRPRLDISTLHEYLEKSLASSKWPQCIVYMDGLPKSRTNKLLRVKLASRLRLPELTDSMSALERTYEASCPKQGTPLEDSIPCAPVSVSASEIEEKLRDHLVKRKDQSLVLKPHTKRAGAFVCHIYNVNRDEAIGYALDTLDRYAVPTHFVVAEYPIKSSANLPKPEMEDAVAYILQGESSDTVDVLVRKMQKLFAGILDLDYLPSPDANFFLLGGSSMLASQVASKIRKRFNIAFSGSEVFQHPSANELVKLIRLRADEFTSLGLNGAVVVDGDAVEIVPRTEKELRASSKATKRESNDDPTVGSSTDSGLGAAFSNVRLAPQGSVFASFFQGVPMFLLFPLWQVSRYLIFFCLLLLLLDNVPGERDIGGFIVAYICFHLLWSIVTPLIFVVIKWTVIGRYKPGRFPIWGSYYLRWWFVDICRKLFLRGAWGSHDVLLTTYYRMLGAKIGKGARISPECDIAEFDLVEVGSEASIEAATFRGFGVDNGAMILGPVKVGDKSSLGINSVVAPYTEVPDGQHLGPVTSSYEEGKGLDPKHARINRKCLPEPTLWIQLVIGAPILFLVSLFSQIPPLAVLFLMLRLKGDEGDFDSWSGLMAWLCEPRRIPYYIGIRIARALLSPFFYMAAAIFLKRVVIGKFKAGPRNTRNQWDLMRYSLAAKLLSRKRIQHVTDLIGRHYELVSVLYRLLGAKVGHRVFWPGHQPIFSGEFDLLEVGDDVVFGSRTCVMFTSQDSCEKVILCAGSNVADNSVVLGGSILGKSSVLGSNSVCPEGWYLPEGSVWFGSTGGEPICLEKGAEGDLAGPIMATEVSYEKLQIKGDESTLTPFGKAFYMRGATYFVWPLSLIIAFTVVTRMIIVVFHTLPFLGALHGAAAVLYGWSFDERNYADTYYGFGAIYGACLFMFLWTNLIRVILWLFVEIVAKWSIIGRRESGRYSYDACSYGQRWELYMIIAKIRSFSRLNILDFFSGTPFMSTYFRLNGGTIGKDCCLYPAGADPFMPEPDLVSMGEGCVIDCASIVCHLNTRGNFELQTITVENNCTLRSGSRVQQGVYMEQGSQLLEKSVALTGEVIEMFSVWVGVPASCWFHLYPDEDDDDSTTSDASSIWQGTRMW